MITADPDNTPQALTTRLAARYLAATAFYNSHHEPPEDVLAESVRSAIAHLTMNGGKFYDPARFIAPAGKQD